MRNLVIVFSVLIFCFVTNESLSQQYHYYAEAAFGNTKTSIDREILYAPGLYFKEFRNSASSRLSVGVERQVGRLRYIPGFQAGIFFMAFGGHARATSDFSEYTPPQTVAEEWYWNNYVVKNLTLRYFSLISRHQFILKSTRKFGLRGLFSLGFNKLNKNAYSINRLTIGFSDNALAEQKFYYGFRNHLFFDLGLKAELFRRRLGVTLFFAKNLGTVYGNGNSKSMRTIGLGLSYQFKTVHAEKLKLLRAEQTSTDVQKTNSGWWLGARLAYKLGGHISSTGYITQNAYPGFVETLRGTYYFDTDFPVMPTLFVSRQLKSLLTIEGNLGYRSSYYSVAKTSTDPNVRFGIDHFYAQNLCLGAMANYDVLRIRDNRLQVGAGLNLWKQFYGDNPVKSNLNLHLTAGYAIGKFSCGFNLYTNLLPVQENSSMAPNLKFNRFVYSEFSVSYALFSFGK